MLEIAYFASGSTGNCYTVSDGKTVIMIDCGLPFSRIQKLTGFLLPDALLISHEHMDHAKAVKDMMRLGIDTYMTAGTAKALDMSGHRLHLLQPKQTVQIRNIAVSAFDTQHDAAEPCGFLLDDGADRLLYATDTYYLRYKFPGLTKIMIEANHSYAIIAQNVKAGILNPALEKRLTKSHFSIENVVDFLSSNDLSNVKEIWLIHLSGGNADPKEFKRMVAAATGKPVYIARG